MQRILTPVLPDQRRLELIKDLSGGFVLKVGSESVLLPPRGAYDFAISILRNLGMEVNETHKRADDFGGNQLRANLKLTG